MLSKVFVCLCTLSKLELWQCGPRLRLSRSKALALSLWFRLSWQFSGLDSRARTALNMFRHALGRRLLTEREVGGGGQRTQVQVAEMCVCLTSADKNLCNNPLDRLHSFLHPSHLL